MKIVVDTNIVFSAVLNTNSRIASILLQSGSFINFYSTDLLLEEITEHKQKLQKISGLSKDDLDKSIALVTKKIRFIDARLIPNDVFHSTEELLKDIDLDDVEFVALTAHIGGRLWSGDKTLQRKLALKNWKHFISLSELSMLIKKSDE
ncbi:MAG: hypothetical protein EOM83_15465 [Clostridia bacterium]|nr:hypothetical protein [Clostridia bacterium]